MTYCDTVSTNVFMAELSKKYPDDIILLVCDGAGWHKSKTLICPENIKLLSIPPYTPEMNPIEQIWRLCEFISVNAVFRDKRTKSNKLSRGGINPFSENYYIRRP